MSIINLIKRIGAQNQYMVALCCLLFTALTCVAFSFNTNDNFDKLRQQVLIRNIGHEVLLQSGDSTSRVLPVTQPADNEYRLRFENEFTFQTDSLVKIVKRSLAKSNFSHNYIVNVLNCSNGQVIFGYAIFKNEQNNIIPCSGRKQPKSCYLISIKFEHAGFTAREGGYLLSGLPLIALLGFVILRSGKIQPPKINPDVIENKALVLGNTVFDFTNKLIITAGITTPLTAKENKLLLIFAQAPQAIIERNRLQKELWEDEGVIVGRSLDMFISKLRKKLEHDSSVHLVNIHGRGYRLEIAKQV
ncbi:helix-turn-helix domain-containing protein [Mucilaginibacter terrae]|uniref:DNA-binding winged helix-turn-helix (WHTH) protein n=1 Tax=Mucilaginibacter terrae TaxID=1955052 RepID=A0ABU3GTU4_9SPHI|nr:winged helix-turn-helix domain-containing protein [Mucilaginibacter terrae]MDT3402986.1 DNA-binding winged helix-turn-helix (wHTH) protein [Mucilaginibacter terrae]